MSYHHRRSAPRNSAIHLSIWNAREAHDAGPEARRGPCCGTTGGTTGGTARRHREVAVVRCGEPHSLAFHTELPGPLFY